MAATQQLLTDLVLSIRSDTADLKKGITEANNQISGFKSGLASVGKAIAGAFTVTAIIAGAKAIFDFGQQVAKATEDVRTLSGVMGKELTDSTAKALAISKTFDKDFNTIIRSANSLSKQLGISYEQALEKIEQGLALSGIQGEEFLDIVKEYPAAISQAGISADQFVAIVSQSLKDGSFSDKGIDAIKEFGLRLREMTPAAQDALTAIGLSGEELQRQISSGSLSTFQALQLVSNKLSTFKGDAQQVGQALADLFGGAGEDAGIKFITSLATINTDLGEMVDQMSAAQKAQLHLSQATTELNKSFTELFAGSNAGWTEMKAQAIDVAVVAIKGIRQGLVSAINYMIQLYNNSILFRTVIQAAVLNFKLMWTTVKAIAVSLYDAFSAAGQLIKALLTGDWDAIPNIIKNGFSQLVENGKTFAADFANNFIETYDNIVNNKPIQLISLTEVENQGTIAGQKFSNAFNRAKAGADSGSGQSIGLTLSPSSDSANSGVPIQSVDADLMGEQLTALNTQITDTETNLLNTQTAWSGFGEAAGEALASTTQGFIDMAIQGKASLKDLVVTALKAIGQIIAKLLVQAIAGLFANETSKSGVIGLGIAAAGVGILLALMNKFSSKSKGFAHGGLASGQFMVGERGPEIMNIGNTVARITPNHSLGGLFNNGGSGQIALVARVSGRDLEFVLSEQQRTRLNTT